MRPLLLLALAGAPVLAQGVPAARPDPRAAFDRARLAHLDAYMQQSVDSQWIAGAVALVLRDGQVVYERAVGWSDREAGKPMTPDAIFRIASQSKAITSAAIMQLIEEGKVALDDPVSRWVPSFARTTVANAADTGRTSAPARRRITIFDLLTHTAGISYGTDRSVVERYRAAGLGPAAGYGWYFADKDEPQCDLIDRLGTLPFVAQPGERFVYGYNTDILGCVVERASGLSLDRYIRERITSPLGMRDTEFFVERAKAARLVVVYRSDSMYHAVRADSGARGQGHYVEGPRRSFSGGAGLTSTARDYARFLEAMRRGGTLDGKRILSPRSVDLMSTDQIGDRYPTDGMGYGLAFETVDRTGAGGFRSVGTYGWGGAYASIYAVDPSRRLVMVLMMNNLPGSPDLRARFATLVEQAFVGDMPR